MNQFEHQNSELSIDHKYPLHHDHIHLFRIVSFAILATTFLTNLIFLNTALPLISLKYFTFWGFYMTMFYFGYMVIKNVRD